MFIRRRKTAMRVWMVRNLSMILLAFGLCLVAGPPAAAQPVQITLLHINDTHSHLAAWGPKGAYLDGTLGGLPKVAHIVAMEQLSDPDALFVHSGDVMDGDFFFNEYLGVAELRLLKSIGLDALVLGNHEFRFGPDFLVEVLQAAWPGGGVPIVGTNLDPKGHALGSWLTPTLVLEAHGIKVGFLGLLSHKAALLNPAPVVINKITNYPLAQAAVNALRGAGAQVVVCLSHAGLDIMRPLATAVSGIDVIVNGHDHALLAQPEPIARLGGGTTFVVSAGEHYGWVGRIRLSVEGGQVSLVDYALLGADADTPPLPAAQAEVDTLKAGIVARYGDVYHQPLAWADRETTLNWDPRKAKRDTPLGNLFTDAYRAWTGTDIALEPFAYMGDPLPKGAIVGADVFRAMSYGDLEVVDGQQLAVPWRLVTFRTTGAALIGVLETLVALGGDYFPQVSGLRFDYDSSAPFGQKILPGTVHVGGHKLLADNLYSISVTAGIYAALKYALGLPMQDIQKLPDLAFEAVCRFVFLRGVLGPAASGRIRDVAAIPGKERSMTSGLIRFKER